MGNCNVLAVLKPILPGGRMAEERSSFLQSAHFVCAVPAGFYGCGRWLFYWRLNFKYCLPVLAMMFDASLFLQLCIGCFVQLQQAFAAIFVSRHDCFKFSRVIKIVLPAIAYACTTGFVFTVASGASGVLRLHGWEFNRWPGTTISGRQLPD